MRTFRLVRIINMKGKEMPLNSDLKNTWKNKTPVGAAKKAFTKVTSGTRYRKLKVSVADEENLSKVFNYHIIKTKRKSPLIRLEGSDKEFHIKYSVHAKSLGITTESNVIHGGGDMSMITLNEVAQLDDVRKRIIESTLRIQIIYKHNGKEKTDFGSGLYIDLHRVFNPNQSSNPVLGERSKKLILTAYHVLEPVRKMHEDQYNIFVKAPHWKKWYRVTMMKEMHGMHGEDPKDYEFLWGKNIPFDALPDVDDNDVVTLNTKVTLLHYPLDTQFIHKSEGVVYKLGWEVSCLLTHDHYRNRELTNRELVISDYNNQTEIQKLAQPGSSGGPIITSDDTHPTMVGILVSGTLSENHVAYKEHPQQRQHSGRGFNFNPCRIPHEVYGVKYMTIKNEIREFVDRVEIKKLLLDHQLDIKKQKFGRDALFTRSVIQKGDIVYSLRGPLSKRPSRKSIKIGPNEHITDRFGIYIHGSSKPTTYLDGQNVIAKRDIYPGEEINLDFSKKPQGFGIF